MDGEERNASLPFLGSHEIFPRTDPPGPRNPVVVTKVALSPSYTATDPLKCTSDASRNDKGGPTEKKEQEIRRNFEDSEWPGVTGS